MYLFFYHKRRRLVLDDQPKTFLLSVLRSRQTPWICSGFVSSRACDTIFSFLPDIPPLSPLVKAVIGCPVCCVSVIGSYQSKRLYLIGSGSAFGSVLNGSDKGVSCLNFEFDIFCFSLGGRPLCPAKTNYSSGKDKNVKRLSPLLWPIIHLLICFFYVVVFVF